MVATLVGDVVVGGNSTSATMTYPANIAAGDTIYLFCLNGNASALTGTGAAGTGIVVTGYSLYGGSTATSDHIYSSSMNIRTLVKTAAGTESGSLTVNWGGGSGGSASRTFWGMLVVPAAYTIQGFTWVDQASLTTATCSVPAVSHTGSDLWATLFFVRGSTNFASITLGSSAATVIETGLGTSSGACSGGLATYNSTPDRDGTVGDGTWQTDSAASAGRAAVTLVATLARVNKTTSTTWDVATSMSRIDKTTATTWDVRARVAKTTATTWDVAGAMTRINKTTATTWDTRARVAKATATTWNVASMISQAAWPAFIAHRFANPGPEETLFAADAVYTTRSPAFWHEGDLQTLNDGTTMVASHDDTIDRLYSAGPVSSGNISSMSPAQWADTDLRVNTGFSGPAQPAMFISEWVNLYGKNTSTPAIGLWENKSGTDIADSLAALAGCQGTVIVNSSTLSDAQAVVAAGFDACLQTNSPTFSQFTSNGIKYLSINYTSMTSTIADGAIAAGVKVLMYTVNSTANRDSMLALFSDTSYAGFISNNPWTLQGTTRISKTTSTTWNTRARVAKTQATTWDVAGSMARIGKTTATSWDVRQRVAKSAATTYDVRARVAKTTAATYDTRARLTKATATTWDARARVSKAVATTWHVRARVSKATSTTFDVASNLVGAEIATGTLIASPWSGTTSAEPRWRGALTDPT